MIENTDVYRRKYEKAKSVLDPVYQRGLENARYYRGDNWSQRDRLAHTSQGFFHAYSIPLIAVKINRILSQQRANRFEAKARGRGQEDELTAEVINMIIKYVDDANQFKWLESEVYQDGLTKLYGVLKIDIDYLSSPLGEIKMTKVPFDQFYYDTNAKDYLLEDAVFVGEYKWLPADKAAALYPDFDFQKDGETAPYGALDHAYQTISNSWYSGMRRTEEKSLEHWLDENNKLVKICEHFEKEYQKRYLVQSPETGDFVACKTRKQAEEFVRMGLGGGENTSEVQPEKFLIIPKTIPLWRRILFTGDTIISNTEHEFSRPPYHRYTALFDDGYCWSLVDLAKDPQKAYDRMMSMIDKSTAKNIKGNNYTVNPDRLHPTEIQDMDALFGRLSSGGSYVKVISPDAIAPINKFNDIRVESSMAAAYQQLIEDLLGGRNYQGLESSSRQTATEIMSLERNATQTGLLYADNLARWKQSVWSYVTELIKVVYTPERTVRVIGEVATKEVQEALQSAGIYKPSSIYAGEVGYLDLSTLGTSLYDCELDIIIDNVESSRTDRDEKFQQIMALNQISIQGYGQPLPFELMLKYSKLDPTIKASLAAFQQQAQATSQQKQKEMADLEKAKQLTEMAKALKPEQDMGAEATDESHEGEAGWT